MKKIFALFFCTLVLIFGGQPQGDATDCTPSYTTTYHLYKPCYGQSGAIWWAPFIANFDTIDAYLAATATGYGVDALTQYGSGTVYTDTTLHNAYLGIGLTNKTLLIVRSGNWTISNDRDWSAYTNVTTLFLPGAVLNHTTKSLKIPNPVTWNGIYQFLNGTGSVVFYGNIERVYGEWFGAVGDGVTDDTNAFLYAYGSIKTMGGVIQGLAKTYRIGNLNIGDTAGESIYNITIRGAQKYATVFKATVGASQVFGLGTAFVDSSEGVAVSCLAQNIKFEDLTIDGNSKASDGINLVHGPACTLHDVIIQNCSRAYILKWADKFKAYNVDVLSNDYGLSHTAGNTSAVDLYGFNHYANGYNAYVTGQANNALTLNIHGGYWSYATTNDLYIEMANSVSLYGLNLENAATTIGPTKDSLIKLGKVYNASTGTGVKNFNIFGGYYTGPSGLVDYFVKVVDSTNTTYPAVRRMNIDGAVIRDFAQAALIDGSTASQVGSGSFTHCDIGAGVGPALSTNWHLKLDNSGVLNLYAPQIIGPVTQLTVFNRTTSLALNAGYSDWCLTNTGAGGTVTFTLPTAAVGLRFRFTVTESSQYIRVIPATGEVILGTGGANKYVQLTGTLGDSMELFCVRAGGTTNSQWAVYQLKGTPGYES